MKFPSLKDFIRWVSVAVIVAVAVALASYEINHLKWMIYELNENTKKVKTENDSLKRYIYYSEYYTKVARLMWGKNANRCDVGLIILVDRTIKEMGVDSLVSLDMVLSLIAVESGFNSYAVSKAGAIGLMQIMEATAKMHEKNVKRDDLFDDAVNVRIGIKELARLVQVFGDKELALLAYNRGQGRVFQLISIGESPRNGYSRMVLGYRILTF